MQQRQTVPENNSAFTNNKAGYDNLEQLTCRPPQFQDQLRRKQVLQGLAYHGPAVATAPLAKNRALSPKLEL
jgi:hypothetical protein